MRNMILRLLPALALIHPVTLLAMADGPDYFQVTGVVANDRLLIRSAASPKAAVIGKIANGRQCVRNLGCEGGLSYQEYATLPESDRTRHQAAKPRWCKIEHEGITGWVNARYLREGSCSR
jgi:hypothetical protein